MIDNPFGGGIKKAPGLLNSRLTYYITKNAQSARPGANTLVRALSVYIFGWRMTRLISETLQKYKNDWI